MAKRCGDIIGLSTGLALGCALTLPGALMAEQITVFAAASLGTAMTDVEAGFEAATGHDLVVSVAGSSALARQIQQGAPADIFISASPDWMDALQADGLLEDGTRFDLLRNTLVLIAHGAGAVSTTTTGPGPEITNDFDLSGRLGQGRLAMALVDAVPAGIYGKAALEHLRLWEDVSAQVAQSDNVRSALALVALGEAPYGIVYLTDAAAEDRVHVVGHFGPETHPPIVYPVADIANRNTLAEAAFLAYLRGPDARAAFMRQGFDVVQE